MHCGHVLLKLFYRKSETDQLKQACKDGDVTKVKELLARDAPLRNLADCLEVAIENKQR